MSNPPIVYRTEMSSEDVGDSENYDPETLFLVHILCVLKAHVIVNNNDDEDNVYVLKHYMQKMLIERI